MDAYEELLSLVKEPDILGSVYELLDWDQEVMMPPDAAFLRSVQSSVLASTIHQKATNPRIGELLAFLEGQGLSDEQAAMVREIRFEYDRSIKVPPALVADIARLASEGSEVWKKARKVDDFSVFAPFLEKMIALKKEYAAAIDPSRPAYEVLFEDYESGLTLEEASVFLEQVRVFVVPLLSRIAKKPVPTLPQVSVPQSVQEEFNHSLAEYIGYDFSKGRLDTSAHPFTSAYGRITTRYEGWVESIMSTIHEAGHGMYEHGLQRQWLGTPFGQSRSLSVHESQSRFWENLIGRSPLLWDGLFDELKDGYHLPFEKEEFIRFINKVEPGFIRVEADELTYPLHIILRFEIERELFDGSLQVKNLPVVWKEKMASLLGITPPSDALGVLQDVHWSSGLFGYFPTYLLGTMISSQLYSSMMRSVPDLPKKIADGDFGEIHSWLRENIHNHGKRFVIKDLIRRATGKEISAAEFCAYLEKKYSALYDL